MRPAGSGTPRPYCLSFLNSRYTSTFLFDLDADVAVGVRARVRSTDCRPRRSTAAFSSQESACAWSNSSICLVELFGSVVVPAERVEVEFEEVLLLETGVGRVAAAACIITSLRMPRSGMARLHAMHVAGDQLELRVADRWRRTG